MALLNILAAALLSHRLLGIGRFLLIALLALLAIALLSVALLIGGRGHLLSIAWMVDRSHLLPIAFLVGGSSHLLCVALLPKALWTGARTDFLTVAVLAALVSMLLLIGDLIAILDAFTAELLATLTVATKLLPPRLLDKRRLLITTLLALLAIALSWYKSRQALRIVVSRHLLPRAWLTVAVLALLSCILLGLAAALLLVAGHLVVALLLGTAIVYILLRIALLITLIG